MYLKLAWRNMWRSRRRTLITVSSILFAVVFAILMRVMIIGIFDKMIADTTSMSCGYLQVHRIGYWANKSVDSSFEETPGLRAVLGSERAITSWSPHLEAFALASSGERTRGILLTGIVPEKEDAVSHLARKIIAGRYIGGSDNGIILAEGLAAYLKLKLDDTVILLGQGFHGEIAAGKYAIKAIARVGVPEMNKSMAWLPMSRCQDFLSTGARYTSISVMLNNRTKVDALKQDIGKRTAGFGYEVMTWQEMLPELDQLFQAKLAQNEIMSGVLYLVITFGIFGTILMMLNERLHEFGILIAIGMKKTILSGIVLMEMLLMTLAGAIAGIAVAFPVVLYFRAHPIRMGGDWARESEQFNFEPVLQPSTDISHFVIQGYVVVVITMVLSLYAIFKIHRTKAIEAINS
ncbi:MAG TPA: FtsX-like permease family protein [Puia sp.]|nr:FtsX-like permease family protein [Puia sp.]